MPYLSSIPLLIVLALVVLLFLFAISWVIRLKFQKSITTQQKEDSKFAFQIYSSVISGAALLVSTFALLQSDTERSRSEDRYQSQRTKDSVTQFTLNSTKRNLDTINNSMHELNKSIVLLNEQVDNVTNSVGKIPTGIESISKRFEQLNNTSQKQYAIMFNQYNAAQEEVQRKEREKQLEILKKPKIELTYITCDNRFYPNSFVIQNLGDLPADILKLKISLPDYIQSEAMNVNGKSVQRIIEDGRPTFIVALVGAIGPNGDHNTLTLNIEWSIINKYADTLYAHYELSITSSKGLGTVEGSIAVCNEIFK